MVMAEVQYAQNTGVTCQLQEFPQECDVVKQVEFASQSTPGDPVRVTEGGQGTDGGRRVVELLTDADDFKGHPNMLRVKYGSSDMSVGQSAQGPAQALGGKLAVRR